MKKFEPDETKSARHPQGTYRTVENTLPGCRYEGKINPTIDPGSENHAKGGCRLDGEIYREMPDMVKVKMIAWANKNPAFQKNQMDKP